MNFLRTFPATRMRRLRMQAFSRNLIRENGLLPSDLIWPVFVVQGSDIRQSVESMPGVERFSLDHLLKEAHEAYTLGIPALAIFPVIDPTLKTPHAEEAWNPEGLVPRVLHTLKREIPELGLITDIALDPYTSHGHDGILGEDGQVANDPTVQALVKQALCHAQAGVDLLGPSDMMDGRIGAIRQALEKNGFPSVGILSYAAKYASAFYSPFRDALGSSASLRSASKSDYQIDCANAQEALHECALDLKEGADILMVKPGMPYLDILFRVKDAFGVPVFAYQTSGEYAMLVAATQNGWLDRKKILMESLLSFKRAGADAVFTYFAKEVARDLAFQHSGAQPPLLP